MKKYTFLLALLFLYLFSIAQNPDFTGIYTHEFEGEISYLEIIQEKGNISGELHDYRGIYYLHGELEGNRGKGLINLGDNAHFFEMDKLGDHLHLYIIDMTEYGEPNYATQYDLLFLPDPDAKKPEKTKHNFFSGGKYSTSDESELISAGRINAPYLGLQFDIPEGFKAENKMSDVILIPNSGFGFIMIFRHDLESTAALNKFLAKGYSDEEMSLAIKEAKIVNDSILEFSASGYFEGEKVIVDGLANIGKFGHGAIMFYVMKEDEYIASAEDELELIESTMSFYPIKEHPLAQRWTFDLKGKSLKYGRSSSSDVVSAELLKSTAWINLCSNKTFKMVIPNDSGEREISEGKWHVEVHYGYPHLVLIDNNSEVKSYQLILDNGRLLMNKERWIVLKGFEQECNKED